MRRVHCSALCQASEVRRALEGMHCVPGVVCECGNLKAIQDCECSGLFINILLTSPRHVSSLLK